MIDGDADLCNDEDGDGAIGNDDGIQNCSDADGSAERPYVLADLHVQATASAPSLTCSSNPNGQATRAALIVCGTTKHIVISDLEITNDEQGEMVADPSGFVNPDNLKCGPNVRESRSGLAALGVTNLTVRNVVVHHIGPAIDVWGSHGPKSLPAITFEGIEITPIMPIPATAHPVPSILVAESGVHFARLNVDGGGRCFGMTVNYGADEGNEVEIEASSFQNLLQAALIGLQANITIRDTQFSAIGGPETYVSPPFGSLVGDGGAIVQVRKGGLDVFRSRFEVRGAAIYTQQMSAVRLSRNFFEPVVTAPSGGVASPMFAVANSIDCNLQLVYNDFNGTRLVTAGGTCGRVFAKYNWWGSATGAMSLQADQAFFDTSSPLPRPWELLPSVAPTNPPPGSPVFGRVSLEGTSFSSSGPITQVRIGSDQYDWTQSVTATGTTVWNHTLDVTNARLGPLRLWLQACDADACGPPLGFDLQVVPRPSLPIALLTANPSIVRIGEPVVLDARTSYSPQGRNIVSYKFDIGNGEATSWSSSAVYEMVFNATGQYPITVTVRDAAGYISANSPQLNVRVVAVELAHAKSGAFTPGLEVVAALVGLAWAAGRRGRK